MYKTIVVACDGTGPGEAALHQGGELAKLCKADLHVLGIVVTAGGLLLDPAILPVDLLATERQILQTALADAVRDLGRRGIKASTSIRDGDPAREIVTYVKDIKADLAIVGHSERGPWARWFEGSVGASLLDTLPCSLLVAIDGAPRS